MDPITIVLAPYALVRAGVRAHLDSRFRILAETDSVHQVIDLAARHTPDLVILSRTIGQVRAAEVARAIRHHAPRTGIVVLGDVDTPDEIVAALSAGVAAVLPPTTDWDTLRRVLLAVAGGAYPINTTVMERPDVAAAVLHQFQDVAHGSIFVPLLPRELAVLELIAAGCSNKEIGQRLHMAEGTVKTHVNNILQKLGVNDRTQAVIAAIRHGVLTIGRHVTPDRTAAIMGFLLGMGATWLANAPDVIDSATALVALLG